MFHIKVIDDNKNCSTKHVQILPPEVGPGANTQLFYFNPVSDNLGSCAFIKFHAPKKFRFIIETTTIEHPEFGICQSLLGMGFFKIVMAEWNGLEYPTYASSLNSVDNLIIDTSTNEFNIKNTTLQFDVYLQ